MKQLALAAAVLALAACSQKADEAPVTDDAAVAAETPAAAEATLAVDGKPDAGTYDVTGPDGSVAKLTINADGTLSNAAGGKVMQGTWTKKGAATYCVTMEGQTAATCYTDTMDGTTWHMTNDADPKDTSTVVRTS